MRLALFEQDGAPPTPAVVVPDGFVLLTSLVGDEGSAQQLMADLISRFDELRPQIDELVRSEAPVAGTDGSLHAPLPRPTNILCCIANYWEHAQRHARPLNMYMKNPDAVVGPGGTIVLPAFTEPWIFMHEAELAIVIKGPAKNVKREDWRSAVFGFTGLIDVTARGKGRVTWRPISWMGKSFDTFAPVGPYITTADDVPDPQDLRIKFWNEGQLRHDYTTDDMEHGVAEIVEFATSAMTLQSGDLIACGTNHEGLGALQDGEQVDLEVERVGRMSLHVSDPLRRTWERGVYVGADSTNSARAGRRD